MKWIFLAIAILIFTSGCNNSSECKEHSYTDCPSECAVCPPCEACSSISCQSEEFCNSIGFNKSWYE